ncbi:hypothetical protein VTN77DRAFT_6521 [Rasamsonia byssochlamydoides]|uniref:uncharacterized protein n=1 Tax=Rasamsonia byssochlamydoides TaxID=89139 RepID=UPI00374476AB
MSATPRKPGNGTTGTGSGASPRSSTTDSPAVGHARNPSKSPNGLQRTPSGRASPVSARAAVRKPGRSTLSVSSIPKISNTDSSDEEARAQNAALIEELKEQLQKAEDASEQYRKQLGVLQMRLDEAIAEQGKLEDLAHEKDSKIEALNAEIREHARQLRELEQAHEQERNAMLQDKEQQASREEELQATIQRLKESLAQKERANTEGDKNVSRSSSFRNRSSPDVDNGQFAPSSQLERSPSRSNSQLLLQKDKLIESLRLELAESQIKLVEMENKGGGRQQELERELLEARMANARLMEDNESYQLLLSEKTLNGDFTKSDFLHSSPGGSQSRNGPGSLAEELESVGEGSAAEIRKLEAEIRALKDQNKALTLYIERIIGRLLQHEGFETILDKSDNPVPTTKTAKTDKELPPTPPKKDDQPAGLLQRAKSVVTGQANRPQPRPRPTSYMPPPSSGPTPHENPETAPSIPLARSQSVRAHRRTRSDQPADGTAAAVVGQMYRGPAGSRSSSGGPMSPTTMGPGSRQSGIFSSSYIPSMSAGRRAPSQGSGSQTERKRHSSSDSLSSDANAEVSSTGAVSTPPSRNSSGMTNYPGAVMQQNKLRPLRLVQENELDDESTKKKANRNSIISWFYRPKDEESVQS